jgi:hypothetical protein
MASLRILSALKQNTKSNNILSKLRLASFSLLTFLQQISAADAKTIYALDSNTNTNYLLNFSSDDFPHLKDEIIKYCNVILIDGPQAIYHYCSSPHCVSDTNPLTPMVNLNVEIGKNLTVAFQTCLNKGMQPLCEQYFDSHASPATNNEPIFLYIIISLIGMAACIGCMVTLCVKEKKNELDESFMEDKRAHTETNWNLSPTVWNVNAATDYQPQDTQQHVTVEWSPQPD